jgi:diguanylate cyclase (GGDEF)-like protein
MENPTRTALRQEVGAELARSGARLGFSAMLEHRFEADTHEARAKHLIRSGIVTMFLTNIFLVPDRLLVPDIFGLACALHAGFSALYSIVLFLTVRNLTPRRREATHAIFVIFAITGSFSLFLLSHAPDRGYLCLTFSLFVVYVNVVTRLRFGWALGFSLSTIVLSSATILASTALPPGIREIAVLTVASAATLTLYANYFIEAGERRAYLLTLDQSLAAQELAEYNARLSALSTTDWLTGAANRRGLELHLAKCWSEAAAQNQPIALLMIDVDYFKLFNDQHGHPAGDTCLTTLSGLISQQLRLENDRLARYGGEEFAVVLPNTTLADAAGVAERIRQAVEDLALPHGAPGAGPWVTVSIGAQSALPSQGGTPEQLISAADAVLYQSKQSGRNRVCPPVLAIVAPAELAKA